MICPCGSGKVFSACCQPYIKFKTDPPTPEALMRARYAAYATGEIDFIEATHSLERRDALDVEETRKWSRESDWLGLTILGTSGGGPGEETGTVEFQAAYSQRGLKNIHHEISTFKKVNGKWYFEEGKVVPITVVRTGEKVGRNDPCPCGSGKKYKKCCG